MTERAAPMYCPYCAEEDLRPHEDAHGAWECRSCTRVFSVRFIGLLARQAASRGASAGSGSSAASRGASAGSGSSAASRGPSALSREAVAR